MALYAARIDKVLVHDRDGIRGYVQHVYCYTDGAMVESFCAASMAQARAIAADWLVRRELDEACDVIEMPA